MKTGTDEALALVAAVGAATDKAAGPSSSLMDPAAVLRAVEASERVVNLRAPVEDVRTTVIVHTPVACPNGAFALVVVKSDSVWDREGTSANIVYFVVDVASNTVVDDTLQAYNSINEWGRGGGWTGATKVHWDLTKPSVLVGTEEECAGCTKTVPVARTFDADSAPRARAEQERRRLQRIADAAMWEEATQRNKEIAAAAAREKAAAASEKAAARQRTTKLDAHPAKRIGGSRSPHGGPAGLRHAK